MEYTIILWSLLHVLWPVVNILLFPNIFWLAWQSQLVIQKKILKGSISECILATLIPFVQVIHIIFYHFCWTKKFCSCCYFVLLNAKNDMDSTVNINKRPKSQILKTQNTQNTENSEYSTQCFNSHNTN